jgi:hypothetical protein
MYRRRYSGKLVSRNGPAKLSIPAITAFRWQDERHMFGYLLQYFQVVLDCGDTSKEGCC